MTAAWLGAIAQMMPHSSKCPLAKHHLANGSFQPEVGANDLTHPAGRVAKCNGHTFVGG